MNKMLFGDLLIKNDGLIKGPFGGDIKKSLFVPKSDDTYKVYEQGVVLNNNVNYGNYYISKEYFKNKLRRFEVIPGDILMTGAGTLGELFTVPKNAKKGLINQALLRIRLNYDVVDHDFFCYYFKHYIKSIISNINGDSVIPNLPPLPIIRSTEIKIPNLSYQRLVASALSCIDHKIVIGNNINIELEALAKTLYDYWFIQFDFPDKNGKPYKSSGGKMIYNDHLKRKIPYGWEVKSLGSINSLLVRGVSPKYKDRSGIEVINQRCIRNNTIDFTKCRYHDNDLKPVSKRLELWDILVNSTGVGTLGRVAIVKRLENEITTADSHVTILRVDPTKAKPLFIGFSMLGRQSEIEQLGEGSTGQTELSRENLSKLKLVLPTSDLQQKFEDFAKPLFEKIANNEKQNSELVKLRDWLLPMLMNGQVKVKELYKAQEIPLSKAVEESVVYSKEKISSKTKQQDSFEKIQVLYTTIWANKQLKVKQGEMATAKDVYLLDRVYGVQTNFVFGQHNWGSFDPEEKKLFNTKQYFHKPKFPNSQAYYLDLKDDGKLLSKVPSDLQQQISNGLKEMHDKVFNKYTGTKKAEKKELFATILKCIEDTQTTDIKSIRKEMKSWKIKQNNTEMTKADKFTEQETKDALKIIIKEGWSKKVLN